MKKIAMINQRYGLEVNGGSEYYTRLIAEHLQEQYEIEVLTTKAVDYVTWENYYTESVENINGITVRRFPVEHTRDMRKFGEVYTKLLQNHHRTAAEEKAWLEEQGPYSPELIQYIEEHADDYDLFVFVTYLYYSTCAGIRKVWDKAVLIPTAHDEPCVYLNIYKDVFTKCKAIVYLTDEERAFVHQQFHNENIPNIVTAVGIDMPQVDMSKQKFTESPYIIYVGRIDESKGCNVLFKYFLEYKKRNPGNLKLVLMGKAVLDIPEHEDIISLGFVSEEEKFAGINNALALILPSHFESLSISVLEALQVETPVIVNGGCDVLKGHCVKSNAGLYYENYWEFEGCLNYILFHEEERSVMAKNGKKYVDNNFTWDIVTDNLSRLFDRAMQNYKN